MAASLFKSKRLVYRCPDPSDEPFLASTWADPAVRTQASPYLPVPPSEQMGKESREYLMEKTLIGVLICLPVSEAEKGGDGSDKKTDGQAQAAKSKPIGSMTLTKIEGSMQHHRNSKIGISLNAAYTGQGYGTEAIEWILRWGFVYAGLHRIGIGAVAYNEGALRLYRRLGFVEEGRSRDAWFFEGRFWDVYSLSMLEDEWRAREAAKLK